MLTDLKCTAAFIITGLPILIFILFYDYLDKAESMDQKEAKRLTLRNLFLYGSILIVLGLLLLMPEEIDLAIWVAILMGWLALIGKFVFDKRSSGKPLLEWVEPANAYAVITGILFLIIAFSELRVLYQPNPHRSHLLQGLNNLLIACYSLLVGLNSSAITDQGIHGRLFFIKWAAIQSYQWVGKKENTLLLKINHRIKLLTVIPMIIPIEKKDVVRKLLQEGRGASVL